jgi:uncharacterized membrane protein
MFYRIDRPKPSFQSGHYGNTTQRKNSSPGAPNLQQARSIALSYRSAVNLTPRPNSTLNTPRARYERLDAMRAVAIVWMVIFHFCFDLNHFKFIQQNFYTDVFWTAQRACIVSLFLFCAGLGQSVAWSQQQAWSRFWRRWAQIAVCAVLVSVGSSVMFPKSFISFGVLHGIALMLIVLRLTSGLRHWLWLLGLLAILLPHWVQHPWFDSRWTNWIGLITRKPVTEDHVPMLPWLGVMWWGMAAGQWVLTHRHHWLTGAVSQALRPMAVLGRWSLSIYMLHQPVLIGVLMLLTYLR